MYRYIIYIIYMYCIYIYGMESYSSIKRNKLYTCKTIWMNFKIIMLSERRQTRRRVHTV